MTKFFLNSKRFWLLVIPFVIQHVVVPLLKKAGIVLPDETVQSIIDAILNLLQASGVYVALQNNPKVTLSKAPPTGTDT